MKRLYNYAVVWKDVETGIESTKNFFTLNIAVSFAYNMVLKSDDKDLVAITDLHDATKNPENELPQDARNMWA